MEVQNNIDEDLRRLNNGMISNAVTKRTDRIIKSLDILRDLDQDACTTIVKNELKDDECKKFVDYPDDEFSFKK